jgi:hypothetical protein
MFEVIFPVFLIAWMFLIQYFLMSASGWKKLPRDNDYVLKQGLVSVINFASLRMDITRYKSCLKLSIYENGLEIKPLPIILWFH